MKKQLSVLLLTLLPVVFPAVPLPSAPVTGPVRGGSLTDSSTVPQYVHDTVPVGIELGTVVVNPDLVHDKCVFDSCYIVFMAVGRPLVQEDRMIENQSKTATGPVGGVFSNSLYLQAYEEARQVKRIYRNIASDSAYNEAAEKQRLVKQLEAFRDTAYALPIIYGDIQTKFKGDVRAYVDDLFAHSAMTNNKTMKWLTISPSVGKLQRDKGFQFAVAKLLYLLWELQGYPQDKAFKSFIPNYWRTSPY